jgi:glycosyltransferase involved in cell wall biosynthesis
MLDYADPRGLTNDHRFFRRMRVALVVGTPPAPLDENVKSLHCGVRDYTQCLAQALLDQGISAQVIAPTNWRARAGLAWVRTLRQVQPDVVHLQYPAIGHRYSLLPHVLGLTRAGKRCVVTLHEHSALSRVQRIANRVFQATADRLIFTTGFEAGAYGASNSLVIPIGSNVPVRPETLPRGNTVLYFGQIRPNKGIETFIALARLSLDTPDLTFLIIGAAPPRWSDYAQTLRADTPDNLRWISDAPLLQVAEIMASAKAAYLPFPDGASLRRGSLIAAIANQLPVITPFGPGTTDALRGVLFEAATPEQARQQLHTIRITPGLARARATAGLAVVQPLDWASIAKQHLAVYHSLTPTRPSHVPKSAPC